MKKLYLVVLILSIFSSFSYAAININNKTNNTYGGCTFNGTFGNQWSQISPNQTVSTGLEGKGVIACTNIKDQNDSVTFEIFVEPDRLHAACFPSEAITCSQESDGRTYVNYTLQKSVSHKRSK